MIKSFTQYKLVYISIIFFTGLILRSALVIYAAPHPDRYIQADAIGYDQLAKNLISGHGFSMETSEPYSPDNFRTPLYPFSIATIYALFGYRSDLVLWVQVLLGALTILLVYFLAELICNQTIGLIAATLYAISPHSITYTALLWSDTEYTLLLTLSILLFIKLLIETRLKWAFAAGLVAGIAVLIHPRSLYLTPVFAIVLIVISLIQKRTARQILVTLATLLSVFYLILLPWRMRNYLVFGVPNITSAAGINMLEYGAALTESAHTGEDQWSIARRYEEEIKNMNPTPPNAAEFGELALKQGVEKIIKDPVTYTKIHLIGMMKIFLPGTSQINTLLTGENILDTSQIYSLLTKKQNLEISLMNGALLELPLYVWIYIGFEIIFLGMIYFFSLFSLFTQMRSFPWLWLIYGIMFYLVLVVGPVGAPRFRVAMMPLICITAACGIAAASRLVYRRLSTLQYSEPVTTYPSQQF